MMPCAKKTSKSITFAKKRKRITFAKKRKRITFAQKSSPQQVQKLNLTLLL